MDFEPSTSQNPPHNRTPLYPQKRGVQTCFWEGFLGRIWGPGGVFCRRRLGGQKGAKNKVFSGGLKKRVKNGGSKNRCAFSCKTRTHGGIEIILIQGLIRYPFFLTPPRRGVFGVLPSVQKANRSKIRVFSGNFGRKRPRLMTGFWCFLSGKMFWVAEG